MSDPTSEETRRANLRRSALMGSALMVLVARAGGSMTIARAEFDAVAAKYGGTSNVSIVCTPELGHGLDPDAGPEDPEGRRAARLAATRDGRRRHAWR